MFFTRTKPPDSRRFVIRNIGEVGRFLCADDAEGGFEVSAFREY